MHIRREPAFYLLCDTKFGCRSEWDYLVECVQYFVLWGEWRFSDTGRFCSPLNRWDGVMSRAKYSGELLGAGRVRGDRGGLVGGRGCLVL